MEILEKLHGVSLHCPTCPKGKKRKVFFEGAKLNFYGLELIWQDIVLFKFTNPCENCGATQIRTLRIGEKDEFNSPKEYLQSCVRYMRDNLKGNTFRREAKEMQRNDLKAERIKVYRSVEDKEGEFKKWIAFGSTFWQRIE